MIIHHFHHAAIVIRELKDSVALGNLEHIIEPHDGYSMMKPFALPVKLSEVLHMYGCGKMMTQFSVIIQPVPEGIIITPVKVSFLHIFWK